MFDGWGYARYLSWLVVWLMVGHAWLMVRYAWLMIRYAWLIVWLMARYAWLMVSLMARYVTADDELTEEQYEQMTQELLQENVIDQNELTVLNVRASVCVCVRA